LGMFLGHSVVAITVVVVILTENHFSTRIHQNLKKINSKDLES